MKRRMVAVIWGIAIGCFIVFIDNFIILRWEIGKTVVFLELAPLLAFIIIALFSFFYLRSSVLGALCGFLAGIVYSILKFLLNHLWPASIKGWISLPLIYMLVKGWISLSLIYMLAGFIGGWLARKKNFYDEQMR